jgi:hypothetical protein
VHHSFNMPMFRRFLNKCRHHKIKLRIIDYYADSLGGYRENKYTGKIKGYKTIENPDSSEKTVLVFLGKGIKFTIDIPFDSIVETDNNTFHISWTYSGPTCGVLFKKRVKRRAKEKKKNEKGKR